MKKNRIFLKSKKGQITVLIIFIMFSFLGYRFWAAASKNSEQRQIADIVKERDEQGRVTDGEGTTERLFPLDMSEIEIQYAIHHMSHQKVKADKKWGQLQITPERIDRLIKVVQVNEQEYDYPSLYINILNRWKENDFSSAVSDHNKLWEIQGGNIGEAKRLLSPKEEKKYIEEYFE
ncbi:DUF6241 domain-containing protein [Bacillus benzoevorans]|uniref:DUF6241 domain-containing protein n=1 Tax=Bacillus benzoevorans TaxID=1456 RepID=UPI00161B2397|nr:DUF6241 domain-containing protein [Bacillus benzoevorans]